MRIPDSVLPYLERAKTWYLGLAARERNVVWGGVLFLLCFAAYLVYVPTQELFQSQSALIEKTQRGLRDSSILLGRYAELRSRLAQIEAKYKKSSSEGVQTYLENLILSKARVARGQFDISRGAKLQLGNSYEQSPFMIKFDTTNVEDVVQLLEEIQFGPERSAQSEPLLITRVDLERKRSDKLSVKIDVSSISNAS